MFKWLFPKKEKLDFEEEFAKDPTSERTNKAFNLMSDSYVEEFFNISSGSLLENIVTSVISSNNENSYNYYDCIKLDLERIEKDYQSDPERAVKNWVNPTDFSEEKYYWLNLIHSKKKIIALNYRKLCTYLDRKQIEELDEDLHVFHKKLQKEL